MKLSFVRVPKQAAFAPSRGQLNAKRVVPSHVARFREKESAEPQKAQTAPPAAPQTAPASAAPLPPAPAPTAEIQFSMKQRLRFGEELFVVGEGEALGNWDVKKAAKLTWGEGDVWSASLQVPPGSHHYKYVVQGKGPARWMAGENLCVSIPESSKTLHVNDTWDGKVHETRVDPESPPTEAPAAPQAPASVLEGPRKASLSVPKPLTEQPQPPAELQALQTQDNPSLKVSIGKMEVEAPRDVLEKGTAAAPEPEAPTQAAPQPTPPQAQATAAEPQVEEEEEGEGARPSSPSASALQGAKRLPSFQKNVYQRTEGGKGSGEREGEEGRAAHKMDILHELGRESEREASEEDTF